MGKLRVKVPEEVSTETISSLLHKYKIFELPPCSLDRIIFDFSDLRFISPTGLVCLVSLMKYSKHSGIANEYYLKHSQYTSVTNYLERMDFYKQFDIERNNINKRSLLKQLCELRQVKTERDGDEITKQLSEIIKNQLDLSDNMHFILSYSIGEILNNIFHHSSSPIQGFACAQTFPKWGKIEISIADCGIGIKQSLIGNPTYSYLITDEEAIRVALGKRVTSKPGHNAGEGLFVTKRFIKENNGEINIFSGKGHVKVTADEEITGTHPLWKGTMVSLIIDLNTPVNIKNILDSEFPEDAVTEDDDLFNDLFK